MEQYFCVAKCDETLGGKDDKLFRFVKQQLAAENSLDGESVVAFPLRELLDVSDN